MRSTGSYSVAAARGLTPRMVDVMRAAERGSSVARTAAELRVSESTVKAIRAALFSRLGVGTITAAIAEARRRGDY